MKIAIIILTKGNIDLLKNCINSIKKYTKYENYKIYIGDTGSSKEELEEIKKIENINLIEFNYYNFAKNNNEIVNKHIDRDTELLLFCNNDIEFLSDIISNGLESYKNEPNCGTIGCLLYFKDMTIQHAGMILYLKPFLQISHYGLKQKEIFEKEEIKPILGNTAALMFISKKTFNEINQFPENYIECFEDVELNLNCILHNKINIFNPKCIAYHFESQTRNKSNEKIKKVIEDSNKRLWPFISKNLNKIIEKIKIKKYNNFYFIK